MSVEVTKRADSSVLRLTVGSTQANTDLHVALDLSLKRHAYKFLEGAQAKIQNSILYGSLDQLEIEKDLHHVGGQLEARMGATGAVAPSWQSQLVAAGRALMTQGGGINVRRAVEEAAATDPTSLFGDYQVLGGRTYRVDNVAIDRLRAPNHCYPIAGPSLWSNVSQTSFAAAAALRRLDLAFEGVRGSLADKWRSMKHLSAEQQRDNELWTAMTGARTQVRMMAAPDHNLLSLVSGRGDLIKALFALP
jgi:hypothetical protein